LSIVEQVQQLQDLKKRFFYIQYAIFFYIQYCLVFRRLTLALAGTKEGAPSVKGAGAVTKAVVVKLVLSQVSACLLTP
jgi:hypothetical protein